MNVCLLSIGNEILNGRTINTNARYLSEGLYRAGFSVSVHYVVADDQAQIVQYLERSFREASIVMVCGGLGPTTDDITRESVAAYLEQSLVFREDLFDFISERYRKLNRQVPESNKKQAMIPENCQALANPVGMAYGIWWEDETCCLAVMPGVPRELEAMFDQSVLHRLIRKYQPMPEQNLLLRTIHLPESMVMQQMQPIMEKYHILPDKIGFYPSFTGVDIVYHEEQLNPGFAEEIKTTFNRNTYSLQNETLMEILQRRMISYGVSLSVAESCTGGLIGKLVTDIPGSSAYFRGGVIVYHNEIKTAVLGVNPETLRKYGAISRETVTEMITGLVKLNMSDYGIALTGYASPPEGGRHHAAYPLQESRGMIPSHFSQLGVVKPVAPVIPIIPVGKVFIACGDRSRTLVKEYQFLGTRESIRHRAAYSAFFQLLELLDRQYGVVE